MTPAEVIEAVTRHKKWLIINGRVIDVGEFVKRHPGGCAVLLAGVGRDVSADFHHVPAHHRAPVTRRLAGLSVAELEKPTDLPPLAQELGRLAEHILLVRNSFEVQRDTARPAHLQLAYYGQGLSHLIADHSSAFRRRLTDMAGPPPPAGEEKSRDLLLGKIECCISELLMTVDESRMLSLVEHIHTSTTEMLDSLLRIVAAGQRQDTAPQKTGEAVQQALQHIEDWTHREEGFWFTYQAADERA